MLGHVAEGHNRKSIKHNQGDISHALSPLVQKTEIGHSGVWSMELRETYSILEKVAIL